MATALTDNPLGVVLHPKTSLTESTDGDSDDNENHTSGGGWALIQIVESDGGDWAFKIQHSSNDSDWDDLLDFTVDGSAVTAEAITVSGAIAQFTRVVATRTSGIVTPVVTFSRNIPFGAVSSSSLSPSASASPSASVSPSSSESASASPST